MKLRELLEDPGTHTFSHSRLWSNVGNLSLTVAFIRDAWLGGLTDMKILAYGGIVTGHALLSKMVSMRWGNGMPLPSGPNPSAPPDPPPAGSR